MNVDQERSTNESAQQRSETSAQQWMPQPISIGISKRSLRESNPSFQIENLQFSERFQPVVPFYPQKPGLVISRGYGRSAQQEEPP